MGDPILRLFLFELTVPKAYEKLEIYKSSKGFEIFLSKRLNAEQLFSTLSIVLLPITYSEYFLHKLLRVFGDTYYILLGAKL